MTSDKINNRRNFMKYSLASIAGLAGLKYIGNNIIKLPKESRTLSDEIYVSNGIVINKTYREEIPLYSRDEINDRTFILPISRNIPMVDAEYNVSIAYNKGIFTINHQDLYERVKKGDSLLVYYKKRLILSRDDDGGLINISNHGNEILGLRF